MLAIDHQRAAARIDREVQHGPTPPDEVRLEQDDPARFIVDEDQPLVHHDARSSARQRRIGGDVVDRVRVRGEVPAVDGLDGGDLVGRCAIDHVDHLDMFAGVGQPRLNASSRNGSGSRLGHVRV